MGGGGGAARVGKNFPFPIRYLPVPGCLLDNSLVLKSAQCCLLLVAISLHSAGDGILLRFPSQKSYQTLNDYTCHLYTSSPHCFVHSSKVIVRLQFVFTAGKNCLDRDLVRVLAVLYPFTFATIVSDVGLTTKLQKCLG